MKLNQLVSKPQLTRLVLEDEETIAQYGEPIEWWMWDRQPLEKFFKIMNADANNGQQIMNVIIDMVLDEEGQPVFRDDATVPTNILMKIITKMTDAMGK
jgi:hypothetical protein